MFEVFADYPLVEAEVVDRQAQGLTTDQAVAAIFTEFNREGPYEFCKRTGRLLNNTAEEFAMQWMTFYNLNVYPKAY
jgi:hypothetical protein